jgi:CheY-like chemotaxis protein
MLLSGTGRGVVPGCRVLLVDDQPDIRETLRLFLELLGCEVETAADGVEGVDKALALRPQLAIVDLGLPRLDGFGVARRLRAALGAGIRLIALTGYGQPRDREQALQAGFDLHRTKPMDLEELATWLSVPPRPPEPEPPPPTEPVPPEPGLPPPEPPLPRPGGPVPRALPA